MDDKDLRRFWKYWDFTTGVDFEGATWHCREWLGKRDHRGYGRFWLDGKWQMSHRVAWQYLTEDGQLREEVRYFTEDLPELHHMCYNRACWEQSHLVPVTHKTNHDDRAARYHRQKLITQGGWT